MNIPGIAISLSQSWEPDTNILQPHLCLPIPNLHPSMLSPCSLVLRNSKFPEPSSLARALRWSSSDKVGSEFSLFKNSVQLPDRKIWWAESQSDMGKEGEKVSGCCVLGRVFVPKSVDLLCFRSTHVARHVCAGGWAQLGNKNKSALLLRGWGWNMV